jgi:tetratricopeptide (TPR) repeat protein
MTSFEGVRAGNFDESLQEVSASFLPEFDRMLRRYVYFNLFFVTLSVIEFALIVIFFPFLMNSSLLAFGLALFFFTLFSFWIFRMYHQTAKEMKFAEIKERVLSNFRETIQYQDGIPQNHLALASFCRKVSDSLNSKETSLYRTPKFLSSLKSLLEQFSCWWHWEEIYQMRELFLNESVKEYIKVVRCAPTSFEVHTALANAYIHLGSLYTGPRQLLKRYPFSWIFSETSLANYDRKFKETSKKAIEEFKILKEFSPNDPWVHLQLAYSYHDLDMLTEEIAEYESVLKNFPEDSDLLFRLGSLYFKLGQNGKGLKVYEELKKVNLKKAENLIALYA